MCSGLFDAPVLNNGCTSLYGTSRSTAIDHPATVRTTRLVGTTRSMVVRTRQVQQFLNTPQYTPMAQSVNFMLGMSNNALISLEGTAIKQAKSGMQVQSNPIPVMAFRNSAVPTIDNGTATLTDCQSFIVSAYPSTHIVLGHPRSWSCHQCVTSCRNASMISTASGPQAWCSTPCACPCA